MYLYNFLAIFVSLTLCVIFIIGKYRLHNDCFKNFFNVKSNALDCIILMSILIIVCLVCYFYCLLLLYSLFYFVIIDKFSHFNISYVPNLLNLHMFIYIFNILINLKILKKYTRPVYQSECDFLRSIKRIMLQNLWLSRFTIFFNYNQTRT